MTNKPMLSVDRELLEAMHSHPDLPVEFIDYLRRVISQPAGNVFKRCAILKECSTSASATTAAAQHQGGIDLTPERLAHAENVIEQQNSVIASLRAELVESYRIDSKHPGEPVTFDDWFRREIGDPNEVNCKGVESRDVYVARKAWDFRQPALVAPFKPDTVVCRRYTLEGHIFYHYDLEPVYGSVPVTLSDLIFMAEGKPVAVVMPERMKVEPFTTIDRGSKNYKAGYNAAIVEVAKLNGLKT